MPLPRDIEAQLRALAYEDTGTSNELAHALESHVAAVLIAVPSAIATTVSNGDKEPRVTVLVTAPAPAGPVVGNSALRLRLPGRDGATLTVFAGQPEALNQLAADLPALLDTHRGVATLADLHPPTVEEIIAETNAAMADASAVDRALGVLLDRGFTLDRGRAALMSRATAVGTTRAAAARALLADIGPQPTPDAPWT